MSAIKHIWFDFSDTIAAIDSKRHDELRYQEFARLRGCEVDENIVLEYKKLYESTVFYIAPWRKV